LIPPGAAVEHRLLWQSEDLTRSATAEELGTSMRTLRRRSAAHLGLSPKALSMSGRMLRARVMLRGRRHTSVADFALELGFDDHAAFANTLRTFTGVTPRAPREEPLVYCDLPSSP
jgi:AraC-like DNA-binding protein